MAKKKRKYAAKKPKTVKKKKRVRAKKAVDAGAVYQVSGLRTLTYDAAYDFHYVEKPSDTISSEIAWTMDAELEVQMRNLNW